MAGRLGDESLQEHVKSTGTQASVQELGEILGSSYESALTPFSSTTNSKNKALELAFGLTPYMIPGYESAPFRIESSERGKELQPSDLTMALARLEPDYQVEDEIDSVGRCPASGRMLRKVWAATIDTCVSSDALFPYDLSQDS